MGNPIETHHCLYFILCVLSFSEFRFFANSIGETVNDTLCLGSRIKKAILYCPDYSPPQCVSMRERAQNWMDDVLSLSHCGSGARTGEGGEGGTDSYSTDMLLLLAGLKFAPCLGLSSSWIRTEEETTPGLPRTALASSYSSAGEGNLARVSSELQTQGGGGGGRKSVKFKVFF